MINLKLDEDYTEYYKQNYKGNKDETAAHMTELLRANKLSKDTYLKLHELMQLGPKVVYWLPEIEKQNVVNGFSQIYEYLTTSK